VPFRNALRALTLARNGPRTRSGLSS